ncbi:MAG: Recombination protein RecR [Candidatus Moranbacteria bacterium GW2011_GWC2_37_73]|nr:MAG: recombination protein RecR, recombination protein RecR [Parcubacteria group bacterium GW2011_GWC1_36_108]KKQ00184.1 MAG: Recombination protein RecR [Candidatus Moranbacteria bacterium GW2011_GWD1_36_198]KKQ01317.1 MAG: Recombination protein RecR [Candidatus Moranbacteria bacterium GW2011_GWD2_36_198]KKQ39765.1 MAG: Recombination protein RecR [Candidatus Moranbacteria bacterium GW2011_GWC2_37_73]HAR99778.1 recombination protein RecR [Candidatus Moranbacteria bacterium]
MYPKAFQKLIKNLASLPSVGPKMAERLVLFLFKQDIEKIRDFAENLLEIKNMKICKRCFNIAEAELCEYCKDERRDQHSICVVEEPLDIISLERTKAYTGLYHVLGGVIQVGDSGAELKIPELISRIENEKITEVILATNPTTEGDATALYLKRKIQPLGIKITRLGRGLSTGADLEYADELTLSEALTNRKELL